MSETEHRYDPEMIRDFFNHLAWELRRLQGRPENPGHMPNAEIGESIKALSVKWQTENVIRRDHMPAPAPLRAKCLSRLNDHRAEEAERFLRALDTLEPLFDEALACVRLGGKGDTVLRHVSYTDFLTNGEFGEWRGESTGGTS